MADRLRRERGLEPFLDQWNLTPGRPWQEEISDALEHSATAAVFVGPSGVNPWQNEEMRQALDRAVRTHDEFRVIPVLLPGADPESLPHFLAQRTWVDFRTNVDDDVALERLASGIRGEAVAEGAFELPDHPAPYRGLLPYEERDADFFFGRDAETAQLVARLQSDRFVAVVGASGSGKSSLVRAGLLSALASETRRGGEGWVALVMTPGPRPLRSLAEHLATLAAPTDRLRLVDELIERFASEPDALRKVINTLAAPRDEAVLLVIDQFEELFTYCDGTVESCREIGERLVANLTNALGDPNGRLRVVITLRADFVDQALGLPALKELLQDRQLLLGAMTDEAVREAVVRPAQAVGALFEKGVVRAILRDVEAEPGALPLLQHALYELWRRRRGPWLTLDQYEESGGVAAALRHRADTTYASLSEAQQEIARHIFLRLTTLGDGVADTRRRVDRSELYPAATDPHDVDSVLQALSAEEARLVVVDEASVEVAHEALLRNWDLLRRWLEENRGELRVQRRLTEAAHEWVTRLERDPEALYRGTRLAEAVEWADRHVSELNAAEVEFLDASRHAARRRVEEERRRNRRLRRRLQVAISGLIVGAIAVVGALWAFADARTGDAERRARDLAVSAHSAIGRDSELAGMLALEAAGALPGGDSDARSATYAALYGVASSPLFATMEGHEDYVWRVGFSPDGTMVVTASYDGSAQLWDLDGTPVSPPFGFGNEGELVRSVAFSPDGTRLVTTSGDEARLWTTKGSLEKVLDGHSATVRAAVFSPDGTLVVTAGEDGTARAWSVEGNQLAVLEGHTAAVNTAEFSPDGTRIVTASNDGTARLWSVAGEELAALEGHTDAVNTAEFNPAGSSVVTASQDDSAKVWSLDGTLLATLTGHDGDVNSATFDPRGTLIATASDDGTARICDTTGTECSRLLGHDDVVWRARFSSDGRIVTAGHDGTARVWSENGTLEVVLGARNQTMWDADFSPDGSRIVTASDDSVAQVWDVERGLLQAVDVQGDAESGESVVALSPSGTQWATGGPNGVVGIFTIDGEEVLRTAADGIKVTSLTYNSDGTQLVTGSADGTARVFHADGRLRAVLDRHDGKITDARFSADGQFVVTAGADATARMWEADGTPGPVLRGHDGTVNSAEFSPDGSVIVTASGDGTARLWEADGTPGPVLPGGEGSVWSASFSRDGTQIVTAGGDGMARLWKADGTPGPVLSGHTGSVFSAAFSPDGRRVITASEDGTGRVWDTDGELLEVLEGHSSLVLSASYSPDQDRIVTASADGTARVWDGMGSVLAVLDRHADVVSSAEFGADGSLIATAGEDGFVRLWHSWSYEEAQVAVSDRLAGRQFTESECDLYGVEPCPARP